MKVDQQVKIHNIYRLKSKDENPISETEPVRVEFGSTLQKGLFFANIKKLKNSDFNGITVSLDVPKSLQKLYRQLDRMGYDFRQRNKKSKVRIIAKRGTLICLVKKDGETEFQVLEPDENEQLLN